MRLTGAVFGHVEEPPAREGAPEGRKTLHPPTLKAICSPMMTMATPT